mmetsp:Transcript_53499/g.88115  ORF Transcript_53499/g.88115 Transcript_53499/m.88115 type:complete len:86 (+) Transcript_53499:1161-1418(+)
MRMFNIHTAYDQLKEALSDPFTTACMHIRISKRPCIDPCEQQSQQQQQVAPRSSSCEYWKGGHGTRSKMARVRNGGWLDIVLYKR